jgi:putative ABC transport system permease protein
MLTFKIAWRNIFRQKRRTVLTVLMMFGGFTLSAVSISWADGTYNNIIDMFTRNQLGHIQIHGKGYLDKPTIYNQITDYQQVGAELMKIKGIETWAPRLYSAGLASFGDKSAGVRIIGIDPDREETATRFDRKIIEGKPLDEKPEHEVVLGKGLARTLKAGIGDTVVIVSQGADGSIADDLYNVVGIAETGNTASDQTSFFLNLKDAQDLLVVPNGIHEMVVIVKKLSEARALATKINTTLNNPHLVAEPWQEFAHSFYVAMKADKRGNWIMLFIIVLLVAIGVLNTVLMTVLERTREYGVLRAIGTRPFEVFRLVIYEISSMAFIGIAIGCGVALLAMYLLSIHGISMPEPMTWGGMVFDKFYTEINAHSFYIPALAVIVSALLVSIFPAIRAARVAPARALRTH